MTCAASRSAISSPASADGATPCGSPDGPTTDLFGQALPHANPLAWRGSETVTTTIATLRPHGSISSRSARLTDSLASRLAARFQRDGSTLYSMSWKRKATPAGRSCWHLVASARRTSEAVSTSRLSGWATATARDHKDGSEVKAVEINSLLGREVWLTGWPTPHANSTTGAGDSGRDGGLNIQTAATLAGWPTATAQDAASSRNLTATRSPDAKAANPGLTLLDAATMAGWPTPMAGTPAQKGYNEAGNTDSSRKTVALCGAAIAGHGLTLPETWPGPARLTASGEMLTGCSAGMDHGGRLNPELSRWLMGFPPEWSLCVPPAKRKRGG